MIIILLEQKQSKSDDAVPPSFIKTIQSVITKVGQLIRLEAKLSGSKPLNVYWVKNGDRITQNNKYKIVEDDNQYILLVIEADMNDQGTYECSAINDFGEARCTCQVRVEAPLIAKQISKEEMIPKLIEPLKDVVVKEGQTATFKCQISNFPG